MSNKLQETQPAPTPLRDNRLPTMRTVFQYESRYWREILVFTVDAGRLMGGPFNLFPDSILLCASLAAARHCSSTNTDQAKNHGGV